MKATRKTAADLVSVSTQEVVRIGSAGMESR
jgi:hypothetical protein